MPTNPFSRNPYATRGRPSRKSKAMSSALDKWMRSQKKSSHQKSRSGLNKTEKKQTRAIAKKAVKAGKENVFSAGWFNYENAPTYGGYSQPQLQAQAILPNIADPLSGAASTIVLQTGSVLTANSATLNTNMGGQAAFPMGGFRYPPISINSEHGIQGDYAHFQSGQISLGIFAQEINNANQLDDCWAPLNFRVLHVKIKGKYLQDAGVLYNKMFLDTENYQMGLSAPTSVKGLQQDLRINTEAVKVLNDIRFKLNQCMRPSVIAGNIAGSIAYAASSGGSAARPQYPSAKYLKLWLENPKKKIRFSDATSATNDYEPLNYNYNEYVIILCYRDQTFAGNGAGGTGQDTSRYWGVAATGMTKIKDM